MSGVPEHTHPEYATKTEVRWWIGAIGSIAALAVTTGVMISGWALTNIERRLDSIEADVRQINGKLMNVGGPAPDLRALADDETC